LFKKFFTKNYFDVLAACILIKKRAKLSELRFEEAKHKLVINFFPFPFHHPIPPYSPLNLPTPFIHPIFTLFPLHQTPQSDFFLDFMSSSHNKSNKKGHNPVVIDLRMTEFGYEIITSKQNTISLSKSMLAKTGKASKDSKDGTSRSHNKEVGLSTPAPSHKSSHTNKSKTAVKPTNIPSKNIPASHSVVKEKAVPQLLQEIEVKRREIFPFIGFTMPLENEPEAPENRIFFYCKLKFEYFRSSF